MRFLQRNSVGDISLTKDFADGNIPRYAILSHTWGEEEVNFKELMNGTGKTKLGYGKIRFCGDQAWLDGLQYFWIDTCCIDKSSSAELQEAINCMFRWYRNAAKCYVQLTDVSTTILGTHQQQWESAFRNSRWFTRGWTLQELIAPATVEFFSQEGIRLGDKTSLEQLICGVTKIPDQALRGQLLSNFSVDERMKWMEHRETTRKEDKAYSLLGIFDVQLPLLYGEGEDRAFERLWDAIQRASGIDLLPVVDEATFDSYAERHNARCHPGTRTDLLRQIMEWSNEPDGKPIFWLNGMAGTGKSTICSTTS